MRSILFAASFAFLFGTPTFSQTILYAGDIAFCAFHATNTGTHWANDGFAFVLLEDVQTATTITFTDAGFVGGAICPNESELQWTTTGSLSAGTVITIEGTNASQGTVTGSVLGLNQNGDQIIAYQSTRYLSAISNSGWLAICNSQCTGNAGTTCLPSGLTNGVHAVDASAGGSSVFNGYYNGLANGTKSALQQALNDPANWQTASTELAQNFPSSFTVSAPLVNPPQAFSVQTFSSNRIDLSATANAAGDSVLIAVNSNSAFGIPSGMYTVGNSLSGGGTVHYLGLASGVNPDLNLSAETQYFYKIWSVNNGQYSNALVGSATTSGNLSAGDISFTAFNADSTDGFAFITWVDLPAGTSFWFTDAAWNDSSFSSSEGDLNWTTASAVSAGSVIAIEDFSGGTASTNLGIVNAGNLGYPNLEDANEVLYLYTGQARQPATFLAAFANSGYSASNGELTGTGLTAGQEAVLYTNNHDIFQYNGSRSGSTVAAFKNLVWDNTQWLSENGTGNQANNAITPDAPLDATAFTFQDFVYNGSWNTNPQGVATLADNISIQSGSVNFSGNITCKNLTIASGASLTVQTGQTLTLAGDLTNNGSLTLENAASLRQLQAADNNSGSGTYAVDREINVPTHRRFSFYSAPLSLVQMGDVFTGSNTTDFYKFDVASQAFASQSPTESAVSGKGFITTPTVQTPPSTSPVIETFTFDNQRGGILHNGPISYQAGAVNQGDFVLTGNPYPSPISAVAFVDANSQIEGALYFWNHTTAPDGNNDNTDSDYAVWNFTGATGNTAELPDDYIQSCQGFMVEATSSSAALDISFLNSMRTVIGNNTQFFKNGAGTRQRLWLNLSSDSLQDRLLLGFLLEATDGYNRLYDAAKRTTRPYFSFYSLLETQPMAIQGLGALNGSKLIPLGFAVDQAQNLSLQLDSLTNWPNAHEIWVVDSLLQIRHNLQQSAYHFSAAAGTYEQRLYLQVGPANVALEESRPLRSDVWLRKDWLQVRPALSIKVVAIYSTQGKRYRQWTVPPRKQYQFDVSDLPAGVYLLKMQRTNGASETQRFLKAP